MAQNVGKKFEDNWKSSVPDNVVYHRLHDAPQSWGTQSSGLRFSWRNPCDCFLFDNGLFYQLELKTTKDNYYTFEKEKDTNKTAKIHYHQIQGLLDFDKYEKCIPGFILNFRINEDDKEKYNEVTYFIHINNFIKMINDLNKKSFTILDLLKYSPIKIESIKKRTNFKYDVSSFLNKMKTIYDQKEKTK